MIKEYEAAIRSQNRQWDREWKGHEAEYNRQQEAIDKIRKCLRFATAKDYAAWLKGFLKWGAVTDYYDRDITQEIIVTDQFYTATRSFKLPSGLTNSHALKIIVPAYINVKLPNDYGHCTIYKMPSDLLGHDWVPVYRDVARLCNG